MTTKWPDLRADVERYDEARGGGGLLVRAFDKCGLAVQKTDLWRYAKVYLEGGLYVKLSHIFPHDIYPWIAVTCFSCAWLADRTAHGVSGQARTRRSHFLVPI